MRKWSDKSGTGAQGGRDTNAPWRISISIRVSPWLSRLSASRKGEACHACLWPGLRSLLWRLRGFLCRLSSPKPTRPCTSTWADTCTPAAWRPSPNTQTHGKTPGLSVRSHTHTWALFNGFLCTVFLRYRNTVLIIFRGGEMSLMIA